MKPTDRPFTFDDRAGYQAFLRDCRTSIALALHCVEIGAYPGPGWRSEAKGLIAIIDHVTKEAPDGT